MTKREAKAKPRRRPGEGSYFYIESKGLHAYRIDLGVDPETGRRRYKQVTGRTQDAALAKFQKLMARRREYGDLPTGGMTLEQWLRQWLAEIIKVKPLVRKNYESKCRLYLIPILGKRRLDALAPRDIRKLHATLEDRGLSASTIHGAHRVLAAALNDAIAEEILTRNVAPLVPPPSIAEGDRDAFTPEQVAAFLKANASDRLIARWVAAFLTGERQGEVLGLEWDRVDLDAGVADVSWQLQRLPYRHGCGEQADDETWPCGRKIAGACPSKALDVPRDFKHRQLHGALCLTKPKTKKSTRLVPLHPHLVRGLRELQQRQAGEPNPHGLVFTEVDGRPIDPSNDSEAWHDALKRAKLNPVPLHTARHTTATYLRRGKADRDVIKDIMGHSTAAVTSAYLHEDMMAKMAAILMLGEMLQIEG